MKRKFKFLNRVVTSYLHFNKFLKDEKSVDKS